MQMAKKFNRLAYDAAIYTFDYDYLFKWLGPKYGFTPAVNEISYPANPIYLIIQDKKPSVRADFVNYKTPNKEYKTVKQWESPDGTLIIKRVIK
jgi:hypothetical protein